jgi:hypothetical protein
MRPETLEQRVANHQELRAVLDGEAEQTEFGFNAITDDRVLYVPHTATDDAAEAVRLCRNQGVVRKKLDKMSDEAANFVYSTTIAKRDPEN